MGRNLWVGPVHDVKTITSYVRRIWNMDKQLPEFCLTFGGTTTGTQTHHLIRITNGIPSGTSAADPWRLKPSLRHC